MNEEVFFVEEQAVIKRLGDKTEKLSLLYQSALVQNKSLIEQGQLRKNQIETKNSELNEIKNQYNTIRFAKQVELTSSDVKETRKMINRMLREIDDCIALINR